MNQEEKAIKEDQREDISTLEELLKKKHSATEKLLKFVTRSVSTLNTGDRKGTAVEVLC